MVYQLKNEITDLEKDLKGLVQETEAKKFVK